MLTKKQKNLLIRIIIGTVLFSLLIIVEKTDVLWFIENSVIYKIVLIVLALSGYFTVGCDVIFRAAKNIVRGHVFDENFLMMIATFGAFAIGDYTEAVAVMLFYQIGELFQNYAVGKSRESISALMSIAPEYANVLRDGNLSEEDPEDVKIGEMIVVKPGEKVPLDGIVRQGSSMLDTASLTGESVPRAVRIGDPLISGCVNGEGTLVAEVTKAYEDSTVSRILELVENASSKKAKAENFITKFARYYTPVVTIGAVLLALVPPLLFHGDWGEWIRRACTFLVISCPCALVISVPLGFFGGIGSASRIGVLVKGSSYLETLSGVKTVVFDKTGTLTKGTFSVVSVKPEGISAERFLEIAAHLEAFSTHPVAKAIVQKWGNRPDVTRVKDSTEIAGQGITGIFDGTGYAVGNAKLMSARGVEFTAADEAGTVAYLASEDRYLGYAVIADEIKENAKEALAALTDSGVTRTVMLTGDRKEAAKGVAKRLSVDEFHVELLPHGKVSKIEEMLENMKGKGKLAFVGDGVNDAPVLMRADVGIAMGSLGSDAAIEAADIVLMDDDIGKIAKTFGIAKKTMRIVRENIIFCLGVKLAVLILGALGIASMWLAVFADVGVCMIAVVNSMRALFSKKL